MKNSKKTDKQLNFTLKPNCDRCGVKYTPNFKLQDICDFCYLLVDLQCIIENQLKKIENTKNNELEINFFKRKLKDIKLINKNYFNNLNKKKKSKKNY